MACTLPGRPTDPRHLSTSHLAQPVYPAAVKQQHPQPQLSINREHGQTLIEPGMQRVHMGARRSAGAALQLAGDSLDHWHGPQPYRKGDTAVRGFHLQAGDYVEAELVQQATVRLEVKNNLGGSVLSAVPLRQRACAVVASGVGEGLRLGRATSRSSSHGVSMLDLLQGLSFPGWQGCREVRTV